MSKKTRYRYILLSILLVALTSIYPVLLLTRNQVVMDVVVQEPLIQESTEKSFTPAKSLEIRQKLVHLDLKGAPPNLAYLSNLLPLFKAAGATGLLIEYEDMFPYHKKYQNITNTHAYKEQDLYNFLKSAVSLGLDIIPLVQTFGHLEYLLKFKQFMDLREVKLYPQEICPSNDAAGKVVMEMIEQVVDFHKDFNLKYLHIGCDEVFHIGVCERCRNKNIIKLFLDRVAQVGKEIERRFGLRGIIWDDMLRKAGDFEVIRQSGVAKYVDLMIWDYTESVDHLISPFLWPMYTSLFDNIWAASAYKGAFGESLYRVDMKRHAWNQISWLQVLTRENPSIMNLRGVAVTGWSRYDHFAILCELLPPAIPSLTLSLQILTTQNLTKSLQTTSLLLKCAQQTPQSLSDFAESTCNYPGNELNPELESLYYTELSWKEIKNEYSNSGKGWLTDYNVHHNATSYWRLEEVKGRCVEVLGSLKNVEIRLTNVLGRYYGGDVVSEWLEQRVGWIVKEVRKMLKDIDGLGGVVTWGRRGR